MRFRGHRATVIVAHPDDEVLGAAGLLQRLRRWDVSVVIVCGRRYQVAADQAADLLEIDPPELLSFEDQRLDMVPVAELADVLARGHADLYITHAEVDLNTDHRVVREATLIAARRQAATVLEMEVPGYAPWNGKAFEPNLYVALSQDELEKKVEAFSYYERRHAPDVWSPELIRALAQVRGSEADTPNAEAFRIVRAVV